MMLPLNSILKLINCVYMYLKNMIPFSTYRENSFVATLDPKENLQELILSLVRYSVPFVAWLTYG